MTNIRKYLGIFQIFKAIGLGLLYKRMLVKNFNYKILYNVTEIDMYENVCKNVDLQTETAKLGWSDDFV